MHRLADNVFAHHRPERRQQRRPDEIAGIYTDVLLTRATDATVNAAGQDGGLVSAILLWALEHDYIDASLVSYLEGGEEGSWRPRPGVASTPEQILAAAGSRYTYSANTLAIDEAVELEGLRSSVEAARPGARRMILIATPPEPGHKGKRFDPDSIAFFREGVEGRVVEKRARTADVDMTGVDELEDDSELVGAL